LISFSFIDGKCPDFTVSDNECKELIVEDAKYIKVKNNNRLLIDCIVENIINCASEKEENILLYVIKLLVSLSTHFNTEVHDNALKYSIKTIIQIYTRKIFF
jgi:hypothetical protein